MLVNDPKLVRSSWSKPTVGDGVLKTKEAPRFRWRITPMNTPNVLKRPKSRFKKQPLQSILFTFTIFHQQSKGARPTVGWPPNKTASHKIHPSNLNWPMETRCTSVSESRNRRQTKACNLETPEKTSFNLIRLGALDDHWRGKKITTWAARWLSKIGGPRHGDFALLQKGYVLGLRPDC